MSGVSLFTVQHPPVGEDVEGEAVLALLRVAAQAARQLARLVAHRPVPG